VIPPIDLQQKAKHLRRRGRPQPGATFRMFLWLLVVGMLTTDLTLALLLLQSGSWRYPNAVFLVSILGTIPFIPIGIVIATTPKMEVHFEKVERGALAVFRTIRNWPAHRR
jgi:hypothetical protein